MIFLKGIISLIKWFLYWLFRFGAAVAPILTAKIGVGTVSYTHLRAHET